MRMSMGEKKFFKEAPTARKAGRIIPEHEKKEEKNFFLIPLSWGKK